jgi:hypothetical protein
LGWLKQDVAVWIEFPRFLSSGESPILSACRAASYAAIVLCGLCKVFAECVGVVPCGGFPVGGDGVEAIGSWLEANLPIGLLGRYDVESTK